MGGSLGEPWSSNPNAPQLPLSLYSTEKANLAGFLIGAIFYGVVVVLFFQCMSALLNPVNRARRNVKWLLAAHIVAMFSLATIYNAMNLNLQSISYIDNRKFRGGGMLAPGPLGYQFSIYSKAISVIPNITYLLNNWLADGLLLYRCFIIYAMNYWAIAFPCVMYVTSVAMGVMLIYYQASQPDTSPWSPVALNFTYPYFTISLSLNVLLTLMVVTRLVLHSRDSRDGEAVTTGVVRWCITILTESSALYATSFLLFIGLRAAKSHIAYILFPILVETHVIAPLLVVLRVTNQNALSSNSAISENLSSIHFMSQETWTDGETVPGRHPLSWIDAHGKSPGELGVVVEWTNGLHRDTV